MVKSAEQEPMAPSTTGTDLGSAFGSTVGLAGGAAWACKAAREKRARAKRVGSGDLSFAVEGIWY
jgi:hypothetical protein